MTESLQSRIYQQLEQRPNARALTFIAANGTFTWQSMREVCERAAALSATLADHGCKPGDICLLVLRSDEFCATALLATLFRGCIPLLIAPPILQDGRNSSLLGILNGILKRTDAHLVIGDPSLARHRAELEAAHPKSVFLFGQAILDISVAQWPSPATPSGSDTAALQLTSGTTGFPRVCRWQQKNVLAALDGMKQAMRIAEDDICLNWTPLYHDMGLVNNFFLALTNGIPLAMLNPVDFVKQPARWLRALHNTGATTTWSPNFGYAICAHRVQDREIEGIRLDRVRSFWNAAERIHLETVRAFYDRFAPFGVRRESLKMNFGCAENIGGATFTAVDESFIFERVDAQRLQKEGVAQPVPESGFDNAAMWVVGAGRPHDSLGIKIVDEYGDSLPDGQVGEILLDTPSRMTEYLGQPEETAKALLGKLLRTGDLGYLRNGELFWTGRSSERITIRGRKIDPSEFESVLLKVPDLRAGCFAAFGVEDKVYGTERIVLISEIREPVSKPFEAIANDIQERINCDLGVGVSDVLLVASGVLAKTSSGKRRHRHFRDLYLEGKIENLNKERDRPQNHC